MIHLLFISLLTVGISLLLVLIYQQQQLEKERKQKELAEAMKMFEQRIALKPKHMGDRHASGAAPVVFGEVDNEDR